MHLETASLPQSSDSDGLPFSEKQVLQHSGNAEPEGIGATETEEELPYGIEEDEIGPAEDEPYAPGALDDTGAAKDELDGSYAAGAEEETGSTTDEDGSP